MRGLTISAHGGLEQLEVRDDLPMPALRTPTDVRVRIHAASLNHLDLFVLDGMPGVTLTPNWIVGADGAGVVDAVGADVHDVHPGDRVIINPGLSCRACEYCLADEQPLCPRYGILGEHMPGTMADFAVVPAANVRTIPDHVPWEEAAAFTLATLTAWRMVVGRANVTARDQVLIWGIGGGVALAALRIAKRRGATVWVTSGSDEKLAWAQSLGADHALNHRTQDVPAEIRTRTGKRGMDVVIDSVGEATWERSLRSLGRRGRLVTCGGTSGPALQTDVRRLFWNQWTIMGSTMGGDDEFGAVTAELRAGRLTPIIDSVHALEDARQAYERMASGAQFGKIVLRVAT